MVFWKPSDAPLKSVIRDREFAAVRRYLQNDKKCRRFQFLNYFDEELALSLPHCELCTITTGPVPSYIEHSTDGFVTIRVLEESQFDSEPSDWLSFVFKKLSPHKSTVLDIFGLNSMEMSKYVVQEVPYTIFIATWLAIHAVF